jgi:transcriptional regulator with XRE-family HTH domain
LVYLADVRMTRGELATRMGYDNTNYLNQMAKGHANIGDATAAKIEAAAGVPASWLDTPHPSLWGLDSLDVLGYVDDLIEHLSPGDLAQLIDRAAKKMASR